MKALVYMGPQKVEYRDEPEPDRRAEDALVKVDAVGICGSDMHAYLGHDERRVAPLILGHEAAGQVVEGPMKGQRVVVNPLVTCGECGSCLSGRSNLCAKREIISMAPRQGAFAEFIALPARNLIPVPDGMDMSRAALAEPIATGWHAVTKAAKAADRPLAESQTLVFGGGAVGLASALSLHAQGCRDILLAETNPVRRETAARSGICRPIDPTQGELGQNCVDVVIDCVGAKPTRMGAIAAVRPGGVIVHVGLSDGADGMDVRKLTLQEITFIGTYTYTMQDFHATLGAMHSGALGDLDWYEERGLSEGKQAFHDLLEGRTGAAKIILRPSEGN